MWEYLVKRILGSDRPLPRPTVSPAHESDSVRAVEEHGQAGAGHRGFGGTGKRTLQCPACDSAMIREKIGPIEIDRCGRCGGIFLDKGELESITRYLELSAEEPPSHHLVYTPHGWE